MRAKDNLRFEVFQISFESRPRIAREQAFYSVEPPGEPGVIGFFEHHSPKFRCALDQLYVPLRNDFSVQRRKEFHQIHSLDDGLRVFGSRGFL
jgi:hypothetical protein